MEIFLLEDEDSIAIGLEYSLKNEGYEVTRAGTVAEAMKVIQSKKFALYMLDISLPDGNGYEVCKKIKESGDYPVIFLTAMDDEVNVIMGLEMGGDDYITKPFRVKELSARIKSVLRRYGKNAFDGSRQFGDLEINTSDMSVKKNGHTVEITSMEYRLLLTFINNNGRVLSRKQILDELWDVDGDFINDNTLTVYIGRLRNKIEGSPSEPVFIKTVRGLGYIFDYEEGR